MEELKQAQEEVRQAASEKTLAEVTGSEDQIRMMIDKIPTLAWSCRPDGTSEFLNQRWLDYTGLSQEESLGWGWKVAIHPEDLQKLMDTWLRLALADGSAAGSRRRGRDDWPQIWGSRHARSGWWTND